MTDDAEAATLAEMADGDEKEALKALGAVKAASDPIRIAGAILGGIGAYLFVRATVVFLKNGFNLVSAGLLNLSPPAQGALIGAGLGAVGAVGGALLGSAAPAVAGGLLGGAPIGGLLGGATHYTYKVAQKTNEDHIRKEALAAGLDPEPLLTADPIALAAGIYAAGALLAGQNPLTGIGEVLKGIGEIIPL